MAKKIVNAALLDEINKAAGRDADKLSISFDDAVDTFINYGNSKGLSEFTVWSYAKELKCLRGFLVDADFDLADIHNLNVDIIEAFVTNLIDAKYARTTINVRLRTAKIFGNYCVRKGYVKTNFALEVSALKVRKKVGATFTKAQLKRLMSAPNIETFEGVRDLTVMTMFADTGIRLSELQAIETKDISLVDNSINVQRTKNGYARRIPLTKRLRAILSAYMRVRGVPEATDILFVTSTESPLDTRSIQYQIRQHGRVSGVIDEIQCSPHVFRRSFAKFKIQAGVDIFTLQALMGHSDISELRNYVAVYSTDLDAAIEKGIE